MNLIYKKFESLDLDKEGSPKSDSDLIQETMIMENEIDKFLQIKGIQHEKEAGQKILIAILEKKCLQSSQFEQDMRELERKLQ